MSKGRRREECILALQSAATLKNTESFAAFIRGASPVCLKVFGEICLNLLYNRSNTIPESIRRKLARVRKPIQTLARKTTAAGRRRKVLVRSGVSLVRLVLSTYRKTFARKQPSKRGTSSSAAKRRNSQQSTTE